MKLYILIVFFFTLNVVKELDANQLSIFFGLFFSAVAVPAVFFIRRVGVFEPIFWFTIYYYVLIYSEFAAVQSKFHFSTFFDNTYFYSNKLDLFSISIWVVLVGYLCFLFSYSLFFNDKIVKKGNYLVRGVSFTLLKYLAYIFMLIAIINFMYNIKAISNFDIISYFEKIKYYSGHFVDFGITIVGYNFMYPSIFFALYLYFNKKINKYTLVVFMFFFLLLVASLGRITGFGMSIIIIYLVFLYVGDIFFLNKKRIAILSIAVLGIISLFFLRMFSEYHRVFDISFDDFVVNELSNAMYILIGEGNLPNIGIVMKIIDSWEVDIGFLYGGSIFVGLMAFLPSSISVDVIQNNTVSWIAKRTWYSDIHGGGLPPTIIGDLFANFGYIGVFFGMFVLGWFFARVYGFVLKKKNFFIFVVYAYFLTRFVFILPKGEFSRISVMVIPVIIITLVLFVGVVTRATRKY